MKRKKSDAKAKNSFLHRIPWRSVRSSFLRFWKQLPYRSVWSCFLRFLKRVCLPVCCVFLCLAVLGTLFAWIISSAVIDKTEERICSPEQIGALSVDFDYILILGCGVYSDGTLTPMLSDRVSVGVSLYKAGVCDRILMSGDHHTEWYNEVDPMKDTAIEQGIPSDAIEVDPLGLSTYESIARIAEIYGAERILIVTQEYHLPRALYIAEEFGMEAYGVGADLRPYRGQIKYDFRELFARVKDVFLTEATS